MREEGLFDGQPDSFITGFGIDYLLFQAMNPDAAVEDFADFTVLAYEDAALGVLGGVARMDSDALPLLVELWATEQDGKPCLELWTPRDHYGIATFGDGRAASHLVGTVFIIPPSGFQRVAEILVFNAGQIFVHHLLADVEPTYRVGLEASTPFSMI